MERLSNDLRSVLRNVCARERVRCDQLPPKMTKDSLDYLADLNYLSRAPVEEKENTEKPKKKKKKEHSQAPYTYGMTEKGREALRLQDEDEAEKRKAKRRELLIVFLGGGFGCFVLERIPDFIEWVKGLF